MIDDNRHHENDGEIKVKTGNKEQSLPNTRSKNPKLFVLLIFCLRYSKTRQITKYIHQDNFISEFNFKSII